MAAFFWESFGDSMRVAAEMTFTQFHIGKEMTLERE